MNPPPQWRYLTPAERCTIYEQLPRLRKRQFEVASRENAADTSAVIADEVAMLIQEMELEKDRHSNYKQEHGVPNHMDMFSFRNDDWDTLAEINNSIDPVSLEAINKGVLEAPREPPMRMQNLLEILEDPRENERVCP